MRSIWQHIVEIILLRLLKLDELKIECIRYSIGAFPDVLLLPLLLHAASVQRLTQLFSVYADTSTWLQYTSQRTHLKTNWCSTHTAYATDLCRTTILHTLHELCRLYQLFCRADVARRLTYIHAGRFKFPDQARSTIPSILTVNC